MKVNWKEAYLQGFANVFILAVFIGCPTIIVFLTATKPPTYSFQPVLSIGILALLWFVVAPTLNGLLIKSSMKDIKMSRIVAKKYIKPKPVRKRERHGEIIFIAVMAILGIGVMFTYMFDEALWLGAKIGFVFGFIGVGVLYVGSVMIYRTYVANRDYQFYKQVLEQNIDIEDINHYKKLRKSFRPRTVK